jgi:hypothetical protein
MTNIIVFKIRSDKINKEIVKSCTGKSYKKLFNNDPEKIINKYKIDIKRYGYKNLHNDIYDILNAGDYKIEIIKLEE